MDVGTGNSWMMVVSQWGKGGRGGGGGCLDRENRVRLKRVTEINRVLPDG